MWLGNKPTINLIIKEDIYSIISYDQMQLINTSITFQKPVNAPIKKGQELGKIDINISGKETLTVPLIAEENISQVNPLFKIFAAIKYLIFGTSLDEI